MARRIGILRAMQEKHPHWEWQWQTFYDDSQWLFTEWIRPNTLEDFRGKDVLDCGCGGGQHINFVSPYAKHVTGVDFNALSAARKSTETLPNVTLIEADLAEMDLGKTFEIVYCIGVLHHTDNPDRTFATIAKHCAPGGRVIVWVYSREGNFLNRTLLESVKRGILLRLPRSVNLAVAHILTALLYLPICTVYLLPLRFLPFYEYFQNWRKLGYYRNLLNVFDKLNAPQTWFITRDQIGRWFAENGFTDVSITPYKGVSWRGSGTKIG
jgi:SAM-dependent methyltransferase